MLSKVIRSTGERRPENMTKIGEDEKISDYLNNISCIFLRRDITRINVNIFNVEVLFGKSFLL